MIYIFIKVALLYYLETQKGEHLREYSIEIDQSRLSLNTPTLISTLQNYPKTRNLIEYPSLVVWSTFVPI